MNGKPLSQDQDSLIALVTALKNKLLIDQTTPPSMIRALAHFIDDNQNALMLHDESPLMQEVFLIRSADQEGPKNPFILFKKFNELLQIASDFRPPAMKIENVTVAINMAQLEAMSKGTKIKREDLPKNVTREAFDKLTNGLRDKIEGKDGPEIVLGAEKYLDDNFQTTGTKILYPIFDDSEKFLTKLLDLSEENVSETEAKWRAVLNNILSKKADKVASHVFTEQEETFISTMMRIQTCGPGKAEGIAIVYEMLDNQYRYNIALSAPETVEEQMNKPKRQAAIMLIRKFIDDNPNLKAEDRPKSLAAFVNDIEHRREYAGMVNSLVGEDKYWNDDEEDETSLDMLLNEKGASALLEIVESKERPEKIKPIQEFIGQVIQKLMASVTGSNALMNELTNTTNIPEAAHHAIYLKNLIGHLVGISHGVFFDRNTGLLNDLLVSKERDEVLNAFFIYVTPESFVDEVVKNVNKDPINNKELLKPLLGDEFWNKDDAKA